VAAALKTIVERDPSFFTVIVECWAVGRQREVKVEEDDDLFRRFRKAIATPLEECAACSVLDAPLPVESLAVLFCGLLDGLARHPRVLAPDLPGNGRSDNPDDVKYDVDFFVGALTGFVDGLGLERFRLVVHDLGGVVGLGFAARSPQRVVRLVVMDTATCV